MSLNCSEGEPYLQYTTFKVVLFSQALSSALAIVVNIVFIVKYFKKIYFHGSLRAILLTSLLMNIVHSLFLGVLQSYHIYQYNTATSGCSVMVTTVFCLCLRGPLTVAMHAFMTLNGAIVVERLAASLLLGKYSKTSAGFGVLLSIVAVGLGATHTYLNQRLSPLEGYTAYCSASNKYTSARLSMWAYYITAIETISIILFFVLYKVNSRNSKRPEFNINVRYQLSENATVFQMILPWMAAHFALFSTFYLANAIIPSVAFLNIDPMASRTAYAVVYVVPFYCLLSPILLYWVSERQSDQRASRLRQIATFQATADQQHNYNQGWR